MRLCLFGSTGWASIFGYICLELSLQPLCSEIEGKSRNEINSGEEDIHSNLVMQLVNRIM